MINGCQCNSKCFTVFSDGAEEEKMETEPDGQQSEKVSAAQHAGSEEVVVMLTNPNYYVLKCLLSYVLRGNGFQPPQRFIFLE